MRVITGNQYVSNPSNIIFKDEENQIVLVFEDKSTVLGNKIAVYNNDGNEIYFLDEDFSQSYDAVNIQKGSTTIANVRIDNHLISRQVKIVSKGKKYNFAILSGILQEDGKKIAKLISNDKEKTFIIELLSEENDEFTCTLLYAIHILL